MTPQGRRLLIGGVVLWMLAAAAYGTLRLTYGQRPAYVHVRWAPTVDAAAKERIERDHGLTRGEFREGRTWGYFLTDLSSRNIRDLVGLPAVEDTHNIHRTAFRIGRFGVPRGAYLGARPAWIAATLEFLVPACLVAGALALVAGLFKTWRARRLHGAAAAGS